MTHIQSKATVSWSSSNLVDLWQVSRLVAAHIKLKELFEKPREPLGHARPESPFWPIGSILALQREPFRGADRSRTAPPATIQAYMQVVTASAILAPPALLNGSIEGGKMNPTDQKESVSKKRWSYFSSRAPVWKRELFFTFFSGLLKTALFFRLEPKLGFKKGWVTDNKNSVNS